MKRRLFVQGALSAATLAAMPAVKAGGRKPRILLRNGWQSQNIGDIAHYMGMMELLKLHGIDAEVRFWTSKMDNGADALFRKHFPEVPFFSDRVTVQKAFEECDFFLHGSCSGLHTRDLQRWVAETGKPFGVMGVSLPTINEEIIETLKPARFVYFRDGVSSAEARDGYGLEPPAHRGWGPDTAFGIVRLRDEEKASAFLQEHGLEDGKFLCCIPRYRWTPAWELYSHIQVNEERRARNEERKEPDHQPHREAIIRLVREAGVKVLVTHEDQTQIALGKEVLYDPLPEDVKKHVVWRDRFWLTDEALSVYARSLGIFGNEMHSPIMCIANDIPAVVGRWDEQTNKGFMWRDIGLDDWLFTMDDEERVRRLPETVLAFATDPAGSREKAVKAREIVLEKQREQFSVLREALQDSLA